MSGRRGTLEALAAHLGMALEPLVEELATPEDFESLMLQLGWDVSGMPPEWADLGGQVADLVSDARRLLDEPGAELAVEVLDGVAQFYATLRSLPAPPGPDPGAFTAEIADRLPEWLLGDYLQGEFPAVMGLLEVLGLVELETHVAADGRPSHGRVRLDWSRLPRVLTDPTGTIGGHYGWGGAAFAPSAVLEELLWLSAGAGALVATGRHDPDVIAGYLGVGSRDPAARGTTSLQVMVTSVAVGDGRAPVGFDLLALPAADGRPAGLALQPNVPTALGSGFSLGDAWEVSLDGGTDPERPVGLVARPGELEIVSPHDPATGLPPGGVGVTLAYTPDEPLILLGSAGASRLELSALSVTLRLDSDGGEPELSATIDADDLTLVVTLGDLGGFLGTLTGGSELRASVSTGLSWSSRHGLSVAGEAGLEWTLYPGLVLGPVSVDVLELGVRGTTAPAPVVTADARVGVSGSLPMLAFAVDRFGIALEVQLTPGNAGPFGIGMAFLPPEGIGLAVDGGVVTGGGYLDVDADGGSYAGVLELEVLEVGVSAVGILDTDVPGVGGWSLLLALFIEVPSIQLGFGFTLTGVGGLAGTNRTIDTDALEAAVRSGGLDAVLFPADPVADAPYVIDQLQSLFPPADGRYVFGPVVRIGWGTPTLVEAQIGVVVELPDPVTVAVLGSVSAVLPTQEVDLVALRLDVAGVVDAAAGTLSVDASLHDSHIVGFALSGDMALRASFGEHPTFLMALGGFHPGFDAPPGFPDMRRLSVGISSGSLLEIHFSSYFAITSNTVQFGAAFEISAEIEGFGIEGGTSFDALITFSPFTLTTRLGFHVAVRAAGIDLAAVWLDANLEGPNPWHVAGTARFTILGIENEIRVDEIIGARQAEPPVPPAELLDAVTDALAGADAWAVVGGSAAGVILAAGEPADGDPAGGDPTSGELVALPDGILAVAQQVVPLGVPIDKVGDAPPGDYNSFVLTPGDASISSSGSVTDWFAPAHYFELTARERLSAPSFEQLTAGIEFGGGDPTAGPARAGTLEFEQILRDPELPELEDEIVGPRVFDMTADPRAASLLNGMATGGVGKGFTLANGQAPVGVAPTEYVRVDRDTGQTRVRAATWSACHQAMVTDGESTVLAPAWEVTR